MLQSTNPKLLQVLWNVVEMDVKKIKVLGDLEIIVRQCNKIIPYVSNHLKNYRQEVWNLAKKIDIFELNSIP